MEYAPPLPGRLLRHTGEASIAAENRMGAGKPRHRCNDLAFDLPRRDQVTQPLGHEEAELRLFRIREERTQSQDPDQAVSHWVWAPAVQRPASARRKPSNINKAHRTAEWSLSPLQCSAARRRTSA